ncbi:MAG TPA: SDR family oxidoreductase [Vicinamibacterales bacterium]|nr:SDR family oxidoreductase [Vicinamibacterales bacterium]
MTQQDSSPADRFSLSGHAIVITGGLGVLGQGIAAGLAAHGANLALLTRNVRSGDDFLGSLEPRDAERVLVVRGDVLDRDSLTRAAETVIERFGRIDALVNGAGGNHPQASTAPDRSFFDLPLDALRWAIDLNLIGTMLPCQVFGRHMAARGQGVILNVSSMNAFRPLTRIPAYSASKAAISNFTRWLAVHMAQEHSPRIRVNAVAPGFFLTAQNAFLLEDTEAGGLTPRGQRILDHTPMGRFGDPGDLLGAVIWLLSPASAFVTGIVVPVDGGFSAYAGV